MKKKFKRTDLITCHKHTDSRKMVERKTTSYMKKISEVNI